VFGAGGCVGPARRSEPDQYTRLRLFESPSLGLLAPMVVPAERREVAKMTHVGMGDPHPDGAGVRFRKLS